MGGVSEETTASSSTFSLPSAALRVLLLVGVRQFVGVMQVSSVTTTMGVGGVHCGGVGALWGGVGAFCGGAGV